MILLASVVILAGFLLLVARYWERHREDEPGLKRGLFVLVAKGMVVPMLLWMLLNSGFMARPPPWATLLQLLTSLKKSAGDFPRRIMRTWRDSV